MSAPQNEHVSSILSIAYVVSSSGKGISLVDALRDSNYIDVRDSISVEILVAALRDDPTTTMRWVQYSEDKRSSGGWYVLRDTFEIGQLYDDQSTQSFETIEEAVANFVLRELDSCASNNAA